jgi:hypothetical protein
VTAASILKGLTERACEALVVLTLEPLWRRHGAYVPASQFDATDAARYSLEQLMRRGLVLVRSRHNPRRYEARLTREGRLHAAAVLAASAEQLTAPESS